MAEEACHSEITAIGNLTIHSTRAVLAWISSPTWVLFNDTSGPFNSGVRVARLKPTCGGSICGNVKNVAKKTAMILMFAHNVELGIPNLFR